MVAEEINHPGATRHPSTEGWTPEGLVPAADGVVKRALSAW